MFIGQDTQRVIHLLYHISNVDHWYTITFTFRNRVVLKNKQTVEQPLSTLLQFREVCKAMGIHIGDPLMNLMQLPQNGVLIFPIDDQWQRVDVQTHTILNPIYRKIPPRYSGAHDALRAPTVHLKQLVPHKLNNYADRNPFPLTKNF